MSKLFHLTLPALAVAMLYGLWLVYSRALERSPEVLIESIDAELTRKSPDVAKILHEIDVALKLAQDDQDREQEIAVLQKRASLFKQFERTDQALSDYMLLLDEYIPGDVITIHALARLEVERGEIETALERVDALLEKAPTWPGALQTRGGILLQMADEIRAEGAEVCQSVLADLEATRAIELTESIMRRDDQDLRRAAMIEEVDSLFPLSREAERRFFNGLVRRAGVFYDNAFADYAHSLGKTDPRALAVLLKMLSDAGRTFDAADFGVANLRWFLSMDHQYSIQLVARTLHKAGRDDFAVRIVNEYSATKLHPSFLTTWIDIAAAEGRWSDVVGAAKRLKNSMSSQEEKAYSSFYHAYALHNQGRRKDALLPVQAYLDLAVRPEPIPEADEIAYGILGDCLAALGERLPAAADSLVRSNKHRAVARPKDWGRALQLIDKAGGDEALLEVALANAMAATPDRADQFAGRWRETAESRMDADRLNVHALRNLVNQRTSWVPNSQIGTYALFLLAEHYKSEGLWLGTYSAAQDVLDEVPFFPPAVDLFVESCDMTGRTSDAIDLLLARLRFLGKHGATVARLDEYREQMTSAQLLEFMRLDPDRTGLDTMARDLLDQDRSFEALVALESKREVLSPEGLFLLGEALSANGRGAEALGVLAEIPPDDPSYARAFELTLDIAIGLEDRTALQTTIDRLVVPNTPVGDLLVPAVEELLVGGQIFPPRRLALFLDSETSTRSGRNLMRLAAIHMRVAGLLAKNSGDATKSEASYAEAEATLERAYAFRSDGGPAIGRILLALQRNDSRTLTAELATLRTEIADGEYTLPPLAMVVIGLLDGRTEIAQTIKERLGGAGETSGVAVLLRAIADEMIEAAEPAIEQHPEDIRNETALFLHGTLDAPHEVRSVLGYLLALHHPDWHHWLVSECGQLGQDHGDLWPRYLRAAALLRSGLLEEADTAITALTHKAKTFAPAWELATELFKEYPPTEEEMYEFARDGWNATSSTDVLEARTLLNGARQAREEGHLQVARSKLAQATRLAPWYSPLLYENAILRLAEENPIGVLDAFARFLKKLPAEVGAASLPRVLETLEVTTSVPETVPQSYTDWLGRLVDVFPESSLLAVRIAERDLLANLALNPGKGAYLAFARLDSLREATDRVSVETLGRGALSEWHGFYLRVSPLRGEAFLRDELEENPGDPELWAMLAETYYEQGRISEARAELDALLGILPNERALRLWIRLLAENGAPVQSVRRATVALSNLLGVDSNDPDIRFLNALAEVNDEGFSDPEQSLESIEELWSRHPEFEPALGARIGRALGIALMRIGNEEQAARAQRVFEELSSFPLPRDELRLYATMALIGPSPSKVQVDTKDRTEAKPDKRRGDLTRKEFKAESEVAEKLRDVMKTRPQNEKRQILLQFEAMDRDQKIAFVEGLKRAAGGDSGKPEGEDAQAARTQAVFDPEQRDEIRASLQSMRELPPNQQAEFLSRLEERIGVSKGPESAPDSGEPPSIRDRLQELVQPFPKKTIRKILEDFRALADEDQQAYVDDLEKRLAERPPAPEEPAAEESESEASTDGEEPLSQADRLEELLEPLPPAGAQKIRDDFAALAEEEQEVFVDDLEKRLARKAARTKKGAGAEANKEAEAPPPSQRDRLRKLLESQPKDEVKATMARFRKVPEAKQEAFVDGIEEELSGTGDEE